MVCPTASKIARHFACRRQQEDGYGRVGGTARNVAQAYKASV